jgi:hypothetical protein
MSTLTVVEYQGVGKQPSNDIQAPMLPYITIQKVTFTGTAGYSAQLNANTQLVQLFTDGQCNVLASTTSSASVGSATAIILATTDKPFYTVKRSSGLYFSVISNS